MKNILSRGIMRLLCLSLLMVSCSEEDAPSTNYNFELSQTNIIEGGEPLENQTITVTATDNVDWRVKAVLGDATWMMINDIGTFYTGSGSINYALAENYAQEPRFAHFVIEIYRNTNGNRELCEVVDIPVEQKGLAPYLFLSDPDDTFASVKGKGVNNLTIGVKSNVGWSAKAYEGESGTATVCDWITITTDAGDKKGNVVFDVKENGTDQKRVAHIIVTSQDGTLSDNIVIKQEIKVPEVGIIIDGMTDYLTNGTAVLTLQPTTGAELNVEVEVEVSDDETILSLIGDVSVGEYTMVNITYPTSTEITMGGNVTITSGALSWNAERWDNTFKVFGGGSEARPIHLATENDLKKLADAVNSGDSYADTYTKLTQNIVLLSDWTPIGNSSDRPFKGNFNGGGYSIAGLTTVATSEFSGLFGYCAGTVASPIHISDLTLTSPVIKSNALSVTGGVVAKGQHVKLSRVTLNSPTIVHNGTGSILLAGGGIIGIASNSIIEDCAVIGGTVSSLTTTIGGICGWMDATQMIRCYNSAVVSMTTGITLYSVLGGLVAVVTDSEGSLIYGCKNKLDFTITVNQVRAGGLVGWNGLPKAQTVFSKTTDTTSGTFGKGATIVGCYQQGNYTNNGANGNSKGGLVGTNFGTVIGCYFAGNFTTAPGNTGGFSGPLIGVNKGVLMYSYCYSNVPKFVGPLGNNAVADPSVMFFSADSWPTTSMTGWDTAPGTTITVNGVITENSKENITGQGWLPTFPVWKQPWATDYSTNRFIESVFPKLAGSAERND